jgi:hypothetical protein
VSLHNQAILYAWMLQMLSLLNDNGVLSTSRPGPLSRREIAAVIRAVRWDPEYRGQTIIIHADDGHPVTLKGR